MEPRRILILAHRTASGAHLQRMVEARVKEGPCRFTLIAPAQSPEGGAWTDGQAVRETRRAVDEAVALLRAAGADIEGIVGDRRPLLAVDDYLRTNDVDEIIVSTFPVGASRWLRQDLPHRVARTYDVLVTHVVDERVPAQNRATA